MPPATQSSKARKPRLWLLVAGILPLLVAYFGWRANYPLEAAELSQRMNLWWDGVREIKVGEMSGLSRNFCDSKTPSGPQPAGSSACMCILFVHGVGDNALTWRRVFEQTSKAFIDPVRLFAVDLPGSGKSPAPTSPEGYQARRLATQLRLAFDAGMPECKRWVVVGNSFGGWVTTWLLLDWPKVSRGMLVGSAGLRVQAEKKRPYLTDGGVEGLKEFQRRAYFRPRELPEYVWRKAAERMRQGNAKELLAAQVPADYVDSYLPQLKRPVMLFWGKADQVTPPEEGRMFGALIPQMIYREAPECGHLPQKECLGAFLKTLNELLAFGPY